MGNGSFRDRGTGTYSTIKTRREVLRGSRKRRLEIERLEDLTPLSNSAIPQVALAIPPRRSIGTQVNFTVGFQNASTTTTGYAAYVDLILPRTGDAGPSPSNPDGITFASATYLGQTLTSTVLTFDAAGHATHLYTVSLGCADSGEFYPKTGIDSPDFLVFS